MFTKRNPQRLQARIFLLVAVMLTVLLGSSAASPTLTFAAADVNKLQIVTADTDKPVYRQNDTITVNVQIKNSGTSSVAGMWVNVWVDKMPIDFLNKDSKYHDAVYQELSSTFGVLTGYMPDPNPSFNPAPNKFITGPIEPGSTQTVSLSFKASGEYTKIQDYTVKVYPWNPEAGENLDGIALDPAKRYGEADSFKARYALEGVKATSPYPDNKRAALVLRVDDVQTGNKQEVEELIKIMDRHNAKGSFMIMNGGAAESRDTLLAALQNGHEAGLHGTDHMCTLPASEHTPEAAVHGHEPPVTWHEFEGPHFRQVPYDEQFRRLKAMSDEIFSALNIRPVSFTAPQVALSDTTIAAATNIGIKYSCNFVGDKPGYSYWNVTEIPFLGDYTWGVNEANYESSLEAACRDLDRIADEGGIITMVLHTIRFTPQNPEYETRYQWFEDFLTYADSKGLWYTTIKDAADWFEKAPKEIVPVSAIPGGPEYLAEQ